MSEFQKVAQTSQIEPNKSICVDIEGQSIAIFNIDGNFYAIKNECPHAGGPLGEGDLQGEIITCPLHAWQFNVKTGVSEMNPSVKVDCISLKVEGEDILISLD